MTVPSSTYRQKGVLLRPVEAVDLVDEEQRALPHLAALARAVEHLAQIGDAGEHRRERLESEIGARRASKPRDRRLAAARRPPQDHRGELPRADHAADRSFGTEQVVLPDDFAESSAAAAGRRAGAAPALQTACSSSG